MPLRTGLRSVLLTASACAIFCLPIAVLADSASPSPPASPPQKKVAILVFNDVATIDYSGPYEVFSRAGYNVYTVAATKHSIRSEGGGWRWCRNIALPMRRSLHLGQHRPAEWLESDHDRRKYFADEPCLPADQGGQ